MSVAISPGEVYVARRRIVGRVLHTPTLPSLELGRRNGAQVHLKLETMQAIGAFKIRGATNCILAMSAAERARGVVTVSTGNHGRAVASAARDAGVRAVVCMSDLVPAYKREAIAALGAEVRIVGSSQDEAEVAAMALVERHGLVSVHPFDDRLVVAGQGTIGLELLDDLGRVDVLVCPLSGGGLLGGIALAMKSAWPALRVIGVSMRRGAAMVQSVRAGRPLPVVEEATLADSLGGGIGLDNRYTFALIRELVDDFVLLDEDEIAAGMRLAFEHEGLVTEGGGAVAIAALGAGRIAGLHGATVACVVSGRNIGAERFLEIVGARGKPA